jgi:hypothetical protein
VARCQSIPQSEVCHRHKEHN